MNIVIARNEVFIFDRGRVLVKNSKFQDPLEQVQPRHLRDPEHTDTQMSWGEMSKGCRATASNILRFVLPGPIADGFAEEFAREFVSRIPKGAVNYQVCSRDIEAWIESKICGYKNDAQPRMTASGDV